MKFQNLASAAGAIVTEFVVKDRYIDSLTDDEVSSAVAMVRDRPLRQMMETAVDMAATFRRRAQQEKRTGSPANYGSPGSSNNNVGDQNRGSCKNRKPSRTRKVDVQPGEIDEFEVDSQDLGSEGSDF